MAITEQNYGELEKASKGYLDISAYDFYFKKVRPFMQEMLLKCKTDGELIRTLEKVMNAGDSLCMQKNYERLIEEFEVLEIAINHRNYFERAMKNAPEAEKEMVRQLATKITDLRMIVKCEAPYVAPEKSVKERINYSPSGENADYISHNMKNLSQSKPKKRIPNI